jgi:SAM-dependent methyltransferase
MREKSDKDPKRRALRSEAADNIAMRRTRERTGFEYLQNRQGWEYVKTLEGVEHLFDYVRTLPSNTILDIGAGTTAGIHQLAQSPTGAGLTFEATTLRYRPEIEENLGKERTHITSGETLRGIKDNSVGCIFGVYSVTYSAAPNLVMQSMNRVLVPGGVVKIATTDSQIWNFYEGLKMMGYDVADNAKWQRALVVLAIKPGTKDAVRARALLDADAETFEEQTANFKTPE